MPTYQIDRYSVRMRSSQPTTQVSPGREVTTIGLYEGGRPRGLIRFFPDGTDLPAAVFHEVHGWIDLRFNLGQFHATMDLLRNERPLYVYYQTGVGGMLVSGLEPVGEEEGALPPP